MSGKKKHQKKFPFIIPTNPMLSISHIFCLLFSRRGISFIVFLSSFSSSHSPFFPSSRCLFKNVGQICPSKQAANLARKKRELYCCNSSKSNGYKSWETTTTNIAGLDKLVKNRSDGQPTYFLTYRSSLSYLSSQLYIHASRMYPAIGAQRVRGKGGETRN